MAMRLMPWSRRTTPVKREEEYPFYALQREMNELMEGFFRGWETPGYTPAEFETASYMPKVDVKETDTAISVTAELPGMSEKDIHVSLNKDVLTISGEKKEENEENVKDYYRVERTYGSFRRTLPIPFEIEPSKIEATFKDGVLTVTLPKTMETVKESHPIEVKKG